MKALEKDRELRYQSAAEIRADLKRLKQTSGSRPVARRTTSMPRSRLAVIAGNIVVLAALLGFALMRARSAPPPAATAGPSPAAPAIRSLAVLPFKPIVARERDEALEFGIADTLIAKISNVRGVTVRPLTAVRRYAGLEQDAIEAGRQLGVDAVLDGTTQNVRDKIRVTARLLRVLDSSQLWSGQFDATFADIVSVYDAISGRLVDELSFKLTPAEQRELRKRDTRNPDAYRAYLLGRYYGRIGRPNFEKSIESFKQAAALDPDYALPYVGLANMYSVLPISADVPSAVSSEAARTAAKKAMDLDPTLADAYTALGFVKFWYDWDWLGAEELYRRAIALNPNYPSAHLFYGGLLSSEGRDAEALRHVEEAQRLDPLTMQVTVISAQCLYQARRFDAAIDQLKRLLDIEPNAWVAHLIMGKAYEQKSMDDEALEHYQTSWSHSFGSTEPLGRLGRLHALRGDSKKARKALAELTSISRTRYVPPYNMALVHVALGQNDQVFSLLDRACRERDVRLVYLRADPAWDPVRSDPRFRKVLNCAHMDGAP